MSATVKKIGRRCKGVVMKPEENIEIRIQQYLDGELSDEQRLDLEEQIASDSSLQEKLSSYALLADGIRFNARKENWEKIQLLEQEAAIDTEIRLDRDYKWYYVAASICAIVAAAILIYKVIYKQTDLGDLYAENFSPYPALIHAPVRGPENPVTIEEKAYAAYSNEAYEEAITGFTTMLEEREDPMVNFYLGNAYMASGNYEAAIKSLEKSIETPMVLETQARWYLGLSYLAAENRELALIQFNELAKGTSTYSEKAKTILKQF